MLLYDIAMDTLQAAGFGAVVCGLYALARRLRGKALHTERLLSVFYLATLLGITIIRGVSVFNSLFTSERPAVQWTFFATTLSQLHRGAWPLAYHVVGNIVWFLPLGFFLRNKPFWIALLAGMLLSVSIETLQWVLITGMPDVDDVLYNTCGAVIGRLLGAAIRKHAAARASGNAAKE